MDKQYFIKNAKQFLVGLLLQHAEELAFDSQCEILVREPGVVILDPVIHHRCNVEIDKNNIITKVVGFR